MDYCSDRLDALKASPCLLPVGATGGLRGPDYSDGLLATFLPHDPGLAGWTVPVPKTVPAPEVSQSTTRSCRAFPDGGPSHVILMLLQVGVAASLSIF